MALFTFTGANGDPIPAAITTQSGGWNIQNNKCVTDGSTGRSIATLDSIPDTSISVMYKPNGGQGNAGLALNYIDDQNFLMVIVGSGGMVQTFQKVDNILTNIAPNGGQQIPSFDNANGEYKLSALVQGNQITAQVDGVDYGTSTTTLVSSTGKHGITSTSDVLHEFDQLAVYTGELRVVGYGQSNMIGAGTNLQSSTPSISGKRATMFGSDYVYCSLEDPTGAGSNRVDLVSADNYAGSWFPRFANKWLEDVDDYLTFIQCARGARKIGELSKDSTLRQDGLNQYEAMIKRINALGGCDVVFYQQGEGDTSSSSTSTYDSYVSDLNDMVNNIKADTGADTFIVPLQTITAAGYDGNGTTTGQNAIRQAQLDVAASNPYARIGQPLTDIDLSGGDGLHFQTDAQLDLVGVRMYESYSAVSSTLTIDISNLPVGTYDVDFYNDTTKVLIETRSITFSDTTLSESLNVDVSTPIFGKIDGDNMPTNGAPFYGVTE